MDRDAYELVRRMWTDFREGGVERALPLLAEDVEFVTADGEVHVGHDGVREFFDAFAVEGRTFEASPYSFERVGSAVLAAGHRRIHGPEGTDGAHLYFVHVVAGGRIVLLSAHPTRADALAAVRGADGAAPARG
ncbi:MAG: nuclear transport factor 2 family protein [Solirubrobacterales bacterium]|nr:nuclear transport factor 2 family protein [Solirubrobacterales bacterium]